ncbi:MAG: type II toxin-antitoxin system RelE/ParE family toxin [Verrucomicrobiota bacterium]
MNLIRISEEALQDLNEGFLFYEAQQIGLGDYFVSSLRSDIERLRIAGGTHRVVFQDFYRLICNIFPFAVYYTHEAEQVIVWAIIDQRRDPVWIRDQLSQ